jgi:glycosyltransferase involved in cell wall biosynthesis
VDGVIASDLDYHIPLEGHENYLGLIPNPVNVDKLASQPMDISEKIIIFHGINRSVYLKKGGDYFDAALAIIQEKYGNRIEVMTVENLPYQEYIEKYNRAHILLDQVYAYDQGYNALEAMAKGKVVFTGAEKEFVEQYDLEHTVAINALPDVAYLVEQLEALILQPETILDIGKNAREFVLKHHHYLKVAERYSTIWGD